MYIIFVFPLYAYETDINTVRTINPEFNYEVEHELFVDPYVLSHIWNGALAINLYGKISQENINKTIKKNEQLSAPNDDLLKVRKFSENTSSSSRRPSVNDYSDDPVILQKAIEEYFYVMFRRNSQIMELEKKLKKRLNPDVVTNSSCCIIV